MIVLWALKYSAQSLNYPQCNFLIQLVDLYWKLRFNIYITYLVFENFDSFKDIFLSNVRIAHSNSNIFIHLGNWFEIYIYIIQNFMVKFFQEF